MTIGVQTLPKTPLSPREAEILNYFLGGRSVTEIARHMGLSVKTISTYMARARGKYGASTNRELDRMLSPPREVANG